MDFMNIEDADIRVGLTPVLGVYFSIIQYDVFPNLKGSLYIVKFCRVETHQVHCFHP